MADTAVVSASVRQEWESKYFEEFVRDNLFAPYMGTTENSIIQLKEQLTKSAGDRVNVPLITRLTNSATTGTSTLEGAEEALGNYNCAVSVDRIRNAVRIDNFEQFKTEMDLMMAAKSMLKFWDQDHLRDDIVAKLLSPVVDGTTAYASATEVQKDAWLAANSDRVLFGNAVANNSANDHSASLSNVDATNDILDAEIVSLAKRLAKKASPHIRPYRLENGSEWFVLFCNSLAFRDLKTSTTMAQANREAWTRGRENPLFQDGDLLFDGVICREVPEIGVISGVGASSIDVAPNFLCGAQALGLAWGKRPTFTVKDDFDYKEKAGVQVSSIRGVAKLMFNSIQHGVVTVYTAGVADG